MQRVLRWGLLVVMLLALYMAFLYAPTEREMGDVQRVFYFHVASAWNGFLAFFVVFVAGILYLRARDKKWDILGLCSAEIGVVFTTLVLLTGPIWAKPVWGTWWEWDPRLTTTLILWFIYVAYLLIRAAAGEEEKGARFAAIFGIIGFLDVPIVFMSIRWWRTIHPPPVIGIRKMEIEPEMLHALLVAVAAFTLLYLVLLGLRMGIERLRGEVNDLKEKLQARI